MSKLVSRILGILMFLLALVFIGYAFKHPETNWTTPLVAVYTIYSIYAVVMVVLLIAPFNEKNKFE